MILFNRIKGKLFRQNICPNSRKLTSFEELVIVRHILDLNSQLFPPQMSSVKDIANCILVD